MHTEDIEIKESTALNCSSTQPFCSHLQAIFSETWTSSSERFQFPSPRPLLNTPKPFTLHCLIQNPDAPPLNPFPAPSAVLQACPPAMKIKSNVSIVPILGTPRLRFIFPSHIPCMDSCRKHTRTLPMAVLSCYSQLVRPAIALFLVSLSELHLRPRAFLLEGYIPSRRHTNDQRTDYS